MIDAKLHKVSKSMSLTGHTTDVFVASMNKPVPGGRDVVQAEYDAWAAQVAAIARAPRFLQEHTP